MDVTDLISKYDAIGLLAEADTRPHEEGRQTKDRTRKRIDDAIKKGHLVARPGNKFILGELIGWAKSLDVWSGKLAEYPAIVTLESRITVSCEAKASLSSCPADLPTCQKRLMEAITKIEALESEIANLRPHAERYREILETNRSNGSRKKGRYRL